MVEDWKLEDLEKRLASEFLVDVPVVAMVKEDSSIVESDIRDRIIKRAAEIYQDKCEKIGKENQNRQQQQAAAGSATMLNIRSFCLQGLNIIC